MIKKFLSFIKIGTFMLVSNLLLVLAIYLIRNEDVHTLASINFTIYVYSLFNMLAESLSKWLTIQLSKQDSSKYKDILYSIYKKSTPSLVLLISAISAALVVIYPEHLLSLVIMYLVALIVYIYMYFRSWINALESYLMLGALLTVTPFFRVISSYFVSQGANYLAIPVALLIAGVILILLSVVFLKNKDKKLFQVNKKFKSDIDKNGILTNIGLQLAINTFWILDGIVLNKILSADIYTSYSTLAFIYKFPFFLSSSFLLVILGENIAQRSNLKKFSHTILKGGGLVVAMFLGVIFIEFIKPGFIHSLVGYEKYYIEGISIIFGFGWLFQTLTYIFYSSIIKIVHKSTFATVEIVASSISFITGILIFNQDLKSLMTFILIHGITFCLLSSSLLYHLIKNIKH